MQDDYMLRQRRKINKRIWELFSLRYLVVFGICLMSFGVLFAFDPPPQSWRNTEITITDMEYRNKPFFFTKHGNPGYKLIDQNGERYWIYEDEAQLQVGETYDVRYVDRGYYRFFQSVLHGQDILVDYQDAVDQWNRDLPLWIAALIVFLLTLAVTARYVHRIISDDKIQQYRENICVHRQKNADKEEMNDSPGIIDSTGVYRCHCYDCSNIPKVCHPERLKKIADFRRESKDLRTYRIFAVNLVRRSFDSGLRPALRMTLR